MPKHDSIKLINTLRTSGFNAECPNCNEPFSLARAEMFYSDEFTDNALKIYDKMLAEINKRREELKKLKKDIPIRSERTTRATNIGFIFERIAPTMSGFNLDPNDCRTIFDPIDYVIFNGLNKRSNVDSVIFMDVKSGDARLSGRQKQIKSLVGDGKVEFHIY